MEGKAYNNPWLGLKSYSEHDRIYGRDADIRMLVQAVLNNNELLFFGKSGIGKSSILMAGLVGMCRQHGYVPVMIRLEHENGGNYLDQIKQTLTEEGIEMVQRAQMRGKHELIWEFFHRHEFKKGGERIKLLLIFDQFEEIFTLNESKTRVSEFFAELADYVNDVKPRSLEEEIAKSGESAVGQEDDLFGDVLAGIESSVGEEYVMDNDIHLVFTIREDFLSEFEYYGRSIPSLKQHRFMLRPLSEEQAAEVIMRPSPGMVSKDVARVIIEKVTGVDEIVLDGVPEVEVDAAVLSLYLEQLFEAKEGDKITRELVVQKGGHIIEKFYEKVAGKVSASTIEYLESELINDDGRRENRSASTIEHHIGRENLQLLVSLQLLRQFRRGNDLMVEFIHDILCPIIIKRKEQRVIEQGLNKRRRLIRGIAIGVSALLLSVVALFTLTYIMEIKEFSAYYAGYVRVNGYPCGVGDELDEDQIQERMIVYKLVRRGYLGKGNHNVRLEVIRKNPQAASGVEMPMVGEAEMEKDANAKAFARLLQTVDHIIFEGEERVRREIACDKEGKTLYVINYYDEGDWRWACFTKANSSPLCVRKTADRLKILYDRRGMERKILFYNASLVPQPNYVGFYGIELTYDQENRKDSVFVLDSFGNRKSVQKWEYKEDMTLITSAGIVLYALVQNEDGTLARRIVHKEGADDIITTYEYQNGRMSGFTTMSGRERIYLFKANADGWSTDTTVVCNSEGTTYRKHTVKDSLNRVLEISYYDAESGEPILCAAFGAHSVRTSWRERTQNCTEKTDRYYDTKGRVTENAKGYAIEVRLLNSQGKVLQWVAFNSGGMRLKSMRYEYRDGVEYKRYAFGVDGTPIRCGSWEQDNLVYYQLSLKQDAYGNFVNGLATNERGEPSIFYFGNYGVESQFTMEPDYKYDSFADNVWGYANASSLSFNPPAGLTSVDYIHIISKRGAAYRAGLRDGDILLAGEMQSNTTVTVRHLGDDDMPRRVTIGGGKLMAEHYKVYLTKEEYENL